MSKRGRRKDGGQKPSGDSDLIFGYAITMVGCRCTQHDLMMTKSRVTFCRRCNIPIRYVPFKGDLGRVFETPEALVERMVSIHDGDTGESNRFRKIEVEGPESSSEVETALETIPETEPQLLTEEAHKEGHGAKAPDAENVWTTFRWLKNQRDTAIEEMNAQQATVDSQRREIETLRAEVERLNGAVSGLKSEVSELSQTLAHRNNELRAERSVDHVRMAEATLEYASAMDNLIRENDSLDVIKEIAGARLQQLSLSLDGCGVNVFTHRVGDHIGNGLESVVVSETATDDPEKDGVVCRVERMGCTFESGVRSAIPERLTVYRYTPPEEGRPEADPAEGDGEVARRRTPGRQGPPRSSR